MRWTACVSTASLAVLINGSPSEYFTVKKGLRHGDSLSPLLFNICANGMFVMLNQVVDDPDPCGVCVGGSLYINHMQFADDVLIFYENDIMQLERFARVLEAFLFTSGLKLNFQKSELIGVNTDANLVAQVAQLLSFSVGMLPIIYLGCPLGEIHGERLFGSK